MDHNQFENKANLIELPDHAGKGYVPVLNRLRDVLRPKTYFEIGTRNGASLAGAKCASLAIDPKFVITTDTLKDKPICMFYQMTSDEFFSSVDPTGVLGGPIDFAFLDGMHLFEFLLRDFINTEKFCRQNSIIALHDCLPTDCRYASRVDDASARKGAKHLDWWTGDVWKITMILKKYRKDLRIIALDAPPTGLVLITNLDSGSRALSENYFSIVDYYSNISLFDFGIERLALNLEIKSTSTLETQEDIFKNFWL